MIWMLACAIEEAPTEKPAPADSCVEDAEFFLGATPLLEDCLGCHVEGGLAAGTRYVLEPFSSDDARDRNWEMLGGLVSTIGAQAFLEKPSGQQPHSGGQRVAPYTTDYAILAELAARLESPGGCSSPGELPPTCEDGKARPGTAPLRRQTPDQLVHSVEALLGVELDPALFPSTTTGNFRSFASLNTVSAAGVEQLMIAAEAASAALEIPEDLGCAEGETEATCARRWSLDFTRRAFRRPLSPAEERLATHFLDAGLDVDTALRMQVELVLQTPQFLYLDAQPLGDTEPARVDPYQVASRLSFFLTDAPPDAELIAAVEAGNFSTRAQVAAQATRLAQAPEALRSVAAFHRDWLHLWRLQGIQRDSSLYPAFSESTVEAMLKETDLYTTELVWSGPATWDSLLFGTRSWVNPELSSIYGTSSSDWATMELGGERPGILTRTAFLTAHAYSADSAPVRRGAWLLQAMLCADLSPPADVNMNLPEASTDLPTIREQLAAHSADPNCASCHNRMDPMGLAFEHFGATGEWRESWDDGYPVDASASLADPAGTVYGAAEMVQLLDSSPRLKSCYTQRVFEYAVGRSAELEDACSLQQLQKRFEESGGSLHQLWVDVTLTDAFLYRHRPEEL